MWNKVGVKSVKEWGLIMKLESWSWSEVRRSGSGLLPTLHLSSPSSVRLVCCSLVHRGPRHEGNTNIKHISVASKTNNLYVPGNVDSCGLDPPGSERCLRAGWSAVHKISECVRLECRSNAGKRIYYLMTHFTFNDPCLFYTLLWSSIRYLICTMRLSSRKAGMSAESGCGSQKKKIFGLSEKLPQPSAASSEYLTNKTYAGVEENLQRPEDCGKRKFYGWGWCGQRCKSNLAFSKLLMFSLVCIFR